MLFTSIPFTLFLILVFILYWFVFNRSLTGQNLFLVISSYIFYGWWDWRFLFLLFFISASNYLIALLLQINNQGLKRKLFFFAGLTINIGTLVLFKYFNFFIDGFINLISAFGYKLNQLSLTIILPLGISFYIFLSLSYIIDVYQNKLTATRNFIDSLLTFSFFPIILAGPIQRPIGLLPQIQTRRIFSYPLATDGLRQILWGAFMKVAIADNCNILVNDIFSNHLTHKGSTLILGVFLFTIQIYADFAGYSNIAIGLGKLLGFNIMQNFAYPYFSRNIKEFWKRWNISLTTWFRDYVFLPIAYSVSRSIKSDRFYFIKTEFFIYTIGISATWILTGLWHGAKITFIIWGLLQGFYLIMNHITTKPRKRILKKLNIRYDNMILRVVETLSTFIIIMFSMLFFRAENIGVALDYISEIFSGSALTIPEVSKMTNALPLLLLILFFIIIEWIGREEQFPIAYFVLRWPKILRWGFYYGIIMIIIYFAGSEQRFIYFQF